MKIQLLDERTWMTMTPDGRMAVVPKHALNDYLDRECPGTGWTSKKVQCITCGETWIELKKRNELLDNCPSCGVCLTFSQHDYRRN